jgi:UDP-N-acetylmuramate dehydrogenase
MYEELKAFGAVKRNESMAKHTTFKIGGQVPYFVSIRETEKLAECLKFLDASGTEYFIVGGGSNMLVRDEELPEVAVHIATRTHRVDGEMLVADAGCPTADIAQASIAAGLTGFEWGIGVPGTVGGAVRGNAGAMGSEMKDTVASVEAYRDGEIIEFPVADCAFGYRDSVFKRGGGVVLRATLRLRAGDTADGRRKAMEHLQYRARTQPLGRGSAGCIFKNVSLPLASPPAIPIPDQFLSLGRISAGWLVEQSGMKGERVGGASVSVQHGNFIVREKDARAADVIALIARVKEKVYDTTGIHLEEEIHII